MKLTQIINEGWVRGRWGIVAAAVLGAILLSTPLGGGLVRWSYDLLFVVRPDIPIGEVAMVYIDSASLDDLPALDGRPVEAGARLDRRYHAQVLSNLTVYGARVVVFDVNFTGYETNEADLALKAAMAHHGRVYVGAWWNERSQPGVLVRSLNVPSELLGGADRWGVTDLNHDPDGAIRRHLHSFAYGKRVPSLSWRVAVDLMDGDPLEWGSRENERWINYYGPEGHFRAISFSEVYLDRSIEEAWFRDKIVFIGAAEAAGYTAEVREAFPSPYTWYTSLSIPGVDVHATTLMNLLRGDWLVRMPRILELVVLIGFAVLAGVGLTRLRPGWALGVALGGGVLVGVMFFALFWIGGVWFPWLLISAVELPVVLVAVLVRSADRGRVSEPASDITVDYAPTLSAEGLLVIPDHEVIRKIGSGGYGDVWLARSVMGVMRAVKVIHRQVSGGESKFEREFEGLKRFEPVSRMHEGLVDILHVGLSDGGGYFFYVMELADDSGAGIGDESTGALGGSEPVLESGVGSPSGGRELKASGYAAATLRSRILRRRGFPAVTESLELGVALASALEFLHGQDLVHRDLKPTNIIYVGGVPKLADIGLVTGAGEAQSFVGTIGYIPPEGPGLASADIYSLGMVLYEASTGLGSEQFPKLPPELEESGERERFMKLYGVILKACEEDVAGRYRDASALLVDLRGVMEGER